MCAAHGGNVLLVTSIAFRLTSLMISLSCASTTRTWLKSGLTSARSDLGPGEFEPAYIDRTIDLSKISGLDMYVNWWLPGDLVAHPMLSWRFEDSSPITISIENREVKEKEYSLLSGFYKQFELIYIYRQLRSRCRNEAHALRRR